jgi:hypothetical protein
MSNNPLKQYFRQPKLYVRLPTKGRWYGNGEVEMNDEGEVPIYPMSAIDDIMLNTPDAMLNGQALEKVICNCVPDIKNIKRLMLPDLEAVFVGIKSATNDGKADYDRKCPKCQHENTFEMNCQAILDNTTFIDDQDLMLKFDGDLEVHVKPYDFEMRQIFVKKEFEEEKALRALDANSKDADEMTKAAMLATSVDRIAQMTFGLVSRSIEKIVILKTNTEVTDTKFITEWLMGISKQQADVVMEAVNRLNATGVMKKIEVSCASCGHSWEDPISFDPASFFGKRS